MRVMMILKADRNTEAGVMPSEAALTAMAAYNEQLVKSGVLLDAAGLKPTSTAARVTFKGGKPHVTDGPFAETKELIAGYWMIQVKSMAEAIEWAKRIPFEHIPNGSDGQCELRQMFELEDFAPGEGVDQHRRLQDEMSRQKG